MYCVKMQASANTATVLDPSTSHLTDALRIKTSESTEEVERSKSSWFERLKPRDDMVASEHSKTEKGCASFERLEVGAQNGQPDCVSLNVWRRPLPNWQAESSSAAKRQKTIEGKEYGDVRIAIPQEKALKSEVGRNIATPAAVLPSEMGFGRWLNLTFARGCDTENTGAASENAVDAASNGQMCFKEGQGNSHSSVNALPKCSRGTTQGETTAAPVLCKPPLSPMHSKLGLPPRPPCQKVSGFHAASKVASLACGLGGGVLHELPIENQPSGQTLAMPAAPVLDVQDRESGKHGESSLLRVGSSFQNPKVLEGSLSDSTRHNRAFTDCSPPSTRMGNGGMSGKQQPMPVVFERENASVSQHIGSSSDVGTGRVVRASVVSSTPGMDRELKFVDSGTETSKKGSILHAASLELSKSTLQQSLIAGGSDHGKAKVNEQVPKASTSATLPWELFIEPAGASRKAREQFVEVYNRARDELKNQRLLQNASKTLDREFDGGPNLTLGPSSAPSDAGVEWQSYSQGQQSSVPLLSQGKSTKLEHWGLSNSSSLKEQNSMIAAESSQSRHVEGFWQVQPVTEGPLRSSHKTVVQEGNLEVSIQRMAKRSVIHGKESRIGDEERRSPVCDRKEVVSQLDSDIKCTGLGQGPGESQKQNNGQDAVPVFGKRSHVTFEDHAMSRGDENGENGSASRPRPQGKPHLWLQRWHATPKYNSNALSADSQVAPDGKRSDSHSYQILRMKKFGDEDGIGVIGQGNTSTERVKCLNTISSKVLPSAAAMAIVGTAARQFCCSQPQGKGAFAFWSGFGMPTYRKVEPVQEKGKEKMFMKANEHLPSS